MKGLHITSKLFIITAVFFILFTSTTMLLQTLFIERFYLDQKMKKFEKSFRAFCTAYGESTDDQETLLAEFEEKNNASIAIIELAAGQLGAFSQDKRFFLRIVDKSALVSDGLRFRVLDNPIIYSMMGSGIMLANSLRQWLSNPEAVSRVVEEGQTLVYKSENMSNGQNSLVGIAPIAVDNEMIRVIMAVTSLQPIGEATTVIRQFYLYFYAFALFLIVILSLVYSKMIAQPLITLNKAALRMSQLDFSAKCPTGSSDEIGSLATTLNFLSEKLNAALTELMTANEKLKADIEKEKQLDRMRNEFIAGVSHELKTPISLISSYAEGIKDNIASGEKREHYLDIIIDEARKMASLVEDMLDLTQLESGSFKLSIEEFAINPLLRSVVERHRANAMLKGIDFVLKLPEDDLEVIGDMFRVEQVLTNLISNASKYSPAGSVVRISAQDRDDNVLIEIENPGEHISEPDMKNIWNQFYRIEKSRNRDLGGRGLGLSIVRNILELHGSNYGVANTEYGVKFFFTLKKSLEDSDSASHGLAN